MLLHLMVITVLEDTYLDGICDAAWNLKELVTQSALLVLDVQLCVKVSLDDLVRKYLDT